jgi:hypothetical protein
MAIGGLAISCHRRLRPQTLKLPFHEWQAANR